MELGNWIGLCGNFQLGIFDVGIDFRGIQVLMAQHLLHGFHIHAPGEHQRCRSVPELMGRILGGVQSGIQNMLLHQPMNGVGGHTAVRGNAVFCLFLGQKQGTAHIVLNGRGERGVVSGNGLLAGFAHIDRAFFVSFAQNTQAIIVNIAIIQPSQLRNSQAAVQEHHQNCKITLSIPAFDIGKQCLRFLQGQILRQRTAELGELNVRRRVFRQLLGAHRQVLEKGLDGRKLPGPGGIFHAFAGVLGFGVIDPIIAQVHEELVNLRGGDPGDEGS